MGISQRFLVGNMGIYYIGIISKDSIPLFLLRTCKLVLLSGLRSPLFRLSALGRPKANNICRVGLGFRVMV